jgi:hypothetical protein
MNDAILSCNNCLSREGQCFLSTKILIQLILQKLWAPFVSLISPRTVLFQKIFGHKGAKADFLDLQKQIPDNSLWWKPTVTAEKSLRIPGKWRMVWEVDNFGQKGGIFELR